MHVGNDLILIIVEMFGVELEKHRVSFDVHFLRKKSIFSESERDLIKEIKSRFYDDHLLSQVIAHLDACYLHTPSLLDKMSGRYLGHTIGSPTNQISRD